MYRTLKPKWISYWMALYKIWHEIILKKHTSTLLPIKNGFIVQIFTKNIKPNFKRSIVSFMFLLLQYIHYFDHFIHLLTPARTGWMVYSASISIFFWNEWKYDRTRTINQNSSLDKIQPSTFSIPHQLTFLLWLLLNT